MTVVPPEPLVDRSYNDYSETLAVSYLATYARTKGFSCDVIDAVFQGLNTEETISAICSEDPDVVGISPQFATSLLSAIKVAQGLRKLKYDGLIAFGGHPATFSWRELLEFHQEVDVVVRGEGEATFVELLSAAQGKRSFESIAGIAFRKGDTPCCTPPRPLLDINNIPIPQRYELTSAGLPIPVARNESNSGAPGFMISSSRGCPFKCSFCSVSAFYEISPGRKWRARNAENVVNEMLSLHRDYPYANTFVFIDDNFLGSCSRGRQRAADIAHLLQGSGCDIKFRFETRVTDVDEQLFTTLKAAGLDRVNLGIESLNPRTLKLYNKKITVEDIERAISILKNLGIEYHPNFIMFEPSMTIEELATMTKTMRKLKLQWARTAAWILTSNRLGLFRGTSVADHFSGRSKIKPWKYPGLTDQDNDILANLGLCYDTVPSDPRMELLQSIHLNMTGKYGELSTSLARLRVKLFDIEQDETVEPAIRDECREARTSIDSWLTGLGAALLNTLDREILAVSPYIEEPCKARSKVERCWDELYQYDKDHLGMNAADYLKYVNNLMKPPIMAG